LSHRILVLRAGRIVAEYDGATATKDDVMRAAFQATRAKRRRMREEFAEARRFGLAARHAAKLERNHASCTTAPDGTVRCVNRPPFDAICPRRSAVAVADAGPGAQPPSRPPATAASDTRPPATASSGAQPTPRPPATAASDTRPPATAASDARPPATSGSGAQPTPRPPATAASGAQPPPRPPATTAPSTQPPRPPATAASGTQSPPRPPATATSGAQRHHDHPPRRPPARGRPQWRWPAPDHRGRRPRGHRRRRPAPGPQRLSRMSGQRQCRRDTRQCRPRQLRR
jgi:hypothetical protein